MATTSVNTRSTCKLSVIKDHTATQLTIFGVISSVALHSSPRHTATVQVQWKFRQKGKENREVKAITRIKKGPGHCRCLYLNSAITVRRLAWVKCASCADHHTYKGRSTKKFISKGRWKAKETLWTSLENFWKADRGEGVGGGRILLHHQHWKLSFSWLPVYWDG